MLLAVLASCLVAPAQRAPSRTDVRYGPHERNTLDFWQCADGHAGPRPLLVYIHGGGWINGDKARNRTFCEPYLAAGIHCAAINYRRTQTDALPAPVHDAARAVQFLRSVADDWGIDAARIALTGGSAGACTSMWLACHDDLADPTAEDPVARQSTRVCAAYAVNGQTSIDPRVLEPWLGPKILEHAMLWRAVGADDMPRALREYDRHAALYREFSPISHVTADDPPLYLSYGPDTSLPAKNAGHAIHHPRLGLELAKKSAAVGHRCHLAIRGAETPTEFADGEHFLLHHLLGDPEAARRARAAAVHRRALTLDSHKDIPLQFAPDELPADPALAEEFRRRFDPAVDGAQQVDFPKMRAGGYDAAFFIVYVAQGQLTPAGHAAALRTANARFDAIDRMLRRYPDRVGMARAPADVAKLHRAGKLVACIGIENGYPMGDDLGLIAEFHRRGARYMSITHNGHNLLGDSHTPPEPLHGGLSELGRRAIAEMNRLGIMVDVSHAGRATTAQAVEASRAPVIASHSACLALCGETRNLDDELLRAIAAKGGVIQVVAVGEFLKDATARRAARAALEAELGMGRAPDEEAPKLDLETRMARWAEGMREIDRLHPDGGVTELVDHIDHVVRVAGMDHVGIASDFDGGGGILGWNDARETPAVTAELLRRGYREAEIRKIWSGNLLRVWREVERVARSGR